MKHLYPHLSQLKSICSTIAPNFNLTGSRMMFSFLMVMASSFILDPVLGYGASRNHDEATTSISIEGIDHDNTTATVSLAATYFSIASGNWNSNTTWSLTQGGPPVGVGIYPGIEDSVNIGTHIVTVTADAAVRAIVIFDIYGGNSSIVVNSGFTLAISGGIYFPSPGCCDNATNTLSGSGTITCNLIKIGNTFTGAGGTSTAIINSSITNLVVSGNISLYGNNKASGPRHYNSKFSIQGGTVTLNGTVLLAAQNQGGAIPVCTFEINPTSTAKLILNSSANPIITTSGTGIKTVIFSNPGSTVNYGGSGAQTIYTPNGGIANAYYNLSINNAAGATLSSAITILNNLTIGDITNNSILNSATFNITGNATGTFSMGAGSRLNLGSTGIATATAFPSAFTTAHIAFHPTSTVTYQANTGQTVSNVPNYANLALSSLSSSNKTFAGATTIVRNLSISGFAVAILPNGSSSTSLSLTLGGVNQPTGSWGGTLSSATYKSATWFGTTTTGILNVNIGCTNGTWLGTFSTNWNNAGNWCGGIPTAITDVIILSATPFQPVIGVAGGLARNLTINSSATLTISGAYTLTVSGNWSNNGTFTPGTSTVNFNLAGGTQTLNNGTSQFYNITHSGTGKLQLITNNITVNNTITNSAGTLDANNLNIILKGNWSNSATFTPGTGTVFFTGSVSQNITGTASTTFNNLTVNNTSGVIAGINVSVNGVLHLQSVNPNSSSGSLAMGTYTLTMGGAATNTGIGDVTGITKRIGFIPGVEYTFGNQFTSVIFQNIGTLPSEVSIKLTLGAAPAWKTGAIQRIYAIIQTGAVNNIANLRGHYLDSELNGNLENTLVFWRAVYPFTPGTGVEFGRTNFDFANNWISISSIPFYLLPSSFGYWEGTMAASNLPASTWNGSVNSTWIEPLNWTPNGVPSDISDVIIPDATTTPNDPTTIFDTTTIKSITIQSGGILNAAVGSIIILKGGSGAWSNVGGTFNHNNGNVIFTHAGSTFAGVTDFYNVTINPGAGLTLESNSIMRIAGTIINSGTWTVRINENTTVEYNGANQSVLIPNGFNPGYHNLILSGTGTKTMPGTALTIHGNFTMSGTSSAIANAGLVIGESFVLGAETSFTAGSFSHSIGGNFFNNGSTLTTTGSSFTFNGTTGQTIGGSTSSTFNNFILNNSSGALLTIDETIGGTLTFINGKISTGTNSLIVSNDATTAIIGASSSNYVNGNLCRAILAGANSYDFPLGTVSVYAPVTINFLSGTTAGSLCGATTDGDHPNFSSSTLAPLSSVNRYWSFVINSGLTTANYNATYNWVTSDQDPQFNFSTAIVGKYTPSTWIYPAIGARTTSSIQIMGATEFGDFQVANGCTDYTASISADNSICMGSSGNLVVSLSGGAGPYTIVYTGDGGGTITNYISGSNIPVSPSETTTYTLLSVTDAAGCTGSISGNPSVTITVSPTGTWLGTTSTDWNTASNWCGGIPTITTDVIITSGPLNQPVIGAAGGLANHMTIDTGASLTITGSNMLTVSGNWTNTGAFIANNSTVNFNGSGSGMIGTSNFNNITFSGAGIETATGILTIAGNVSITNNFTAGAFTHTVGGNWTRTGTFVATGSTIDFNGAGAGNIGASNFNHIIFSGTGLKAATGPLTIVGNITIDNNFSGNSHTHSLAGNWTNNGSFISDGGTIIFNGPVTQIISGSSISTFNGLTINNNGGVTATLDIVVNGVLHLQSPNPESTRGSLEMGAFTLFMGASASTVGLGDVTGVVTRTSFIPGVEYSFGNQFTTINFQNAGTLPSMVSFKTIIGFAPVWKTNGIERIYELIQVGALGSFATINVHYLDGELNGNTESELVYWYNQYPFTPGLEAELGKSNYNLTENWIGLSLLPVDQIPSGFGQLQATLGNSLITAFTWNGTISTEWNNVFNWTPNGIPNAPVDDVIIPDSSLTLFDPILPDDSLTIGRITIEANGVLNAATNSILTLAEGTGAWVNIGGTFNANVSTVIFTNPAATLAGTTNFYNVTIASGAALIPGTGSIMRIAGTMINSGLWRAAQNPNNTVEYNGANQTVLNPNGLIPGYYNLILSGTGIKTMPVTAMQIHGDFSMAGTAVTTAGAALTITGDFILGAGTTFNTAILAHSIGGDFLNNGGIFNAAGSTITLNGTDSQTIGGSILTTFDNLTINNTSGAVLDINENIAGVLNFINGIISTRTNTLYIDNADPGAILGASSSNYVNGNLDREIASGANTYFYPIGTDMVYAPVSIAFGAGTTSGGLTGFTRDGDHPDIESSTLAVTSSVNRYWSFAISHGLTSSNYNAIYNWVAGDEDPAFDFATAVVGKFDNASDWTYPAVGLRTVTSTGATGMSGFGDFQVANGCSAFTAMLSGPSTICTGSEGNLVVIISGGISPYIITYSGDGGDTIINYTSGTDIPISPSENTTYTLISVTDAGSCIGTILGSPMVTVTLNPDGTWLGTTSTDWHTGSNWCGGVPTATTDVNIPAGGNQPVIGAAAFSRNLSINTGATLTITGTNTLTNFGNWTRAGTFIANNSTVIFDGPGINNIGASNFYNVSFFGTGPSLAAGALTIAGNIIINDNFKAGAYTHTVGGNWTNNGSFLADGSTIIFTGASVQTIDGTSETAFNNLTTNNVSGIVANSDFTVNGVLHLQSANPSISLGNITLGAQTLTMGGSATTIGIGDVTGIVKRTSFVPYTIYAFGNQYTTVAFQNSGTLPTDFSIKTNIGAAPAWKTDGILRTYEIIQNGAVGGAATINVHYLDAELNGNLENDLVYWYNSYPFTPGTEVEVGKSSYDLTNNWVGLSSIPTYLLPTGFGQLEATLGSSELTNYTWNGSTDSDWLTPANWTPNGTPSNNDDVIIPDASTTPNDPILPIDLWTIGRLTIQNGGILNATPTSIFTISGGGGAWINDGGVFNASTSEVTFTNGGATMSGTTDFYNLTTAFGSDLRLSDGAFIRIAGTFTNNGLFHAVGPGTTTVEYNGGNQNVVIPNPTSHRYDNLILSGSGIKTMPGTPLNVNGDFTMTGTASTTAGAAMIFSGDFTLESGTSFNTGAFSHTIAGDFTNNNATFTATGSTITLNGTTVQIIGGSNPSTFENLTINSAGVILENTITVSGILTLITGIVDAELYNLIISNDQPGSVVGGSSITYIKGNLQRAIATGANTYHFPVGSNPYTPVVLEFTSGTAPGSLVVSTTPGDHPAITSSDLNEHQSVNRFWSMTADSGFDPVKYNATFNWVVSDEDPEFDWTAAQLGKYSGNGWSYPVVGTRTETSTEITNQSSFGDFQIAEACNEPDVPTIAASPGSVVCIGTTVTLSIATGLLNDALDWQWYTDSCGGTAEGTGTSIMITPSVTTTYYVRGEGGCARLGLCASITITVDAQPIVSDQPDQTQCNTSTFTMTQTTPIIGTGVWTLESGSATITAPGLPNTTVTGLAPGTNAVLRWTVTNGTCSAFDQVTLTNRSLPVCSNTGSNTLCPLSTNNIYTAPPGLTYVWAISGNGTIIGSTTSQSVTVDAGPLCNSSFELSLTVIDGSGCSTNCINTVNVLDNSTPVITGTIAGATIEGCAAAEAFAPVTTVAELEALGLTVTDDCTLDASLAVNNSDAFSGTCPIVVTRTYTITDACGNAVNAIQIINVDDTAAPVITGTIADVTIEGCAAGDVFAPVTTVTALEALGLTIMDACTVNGSLAVTSADAISGICPVIVTRTYFITDMCGNAIAVVQLISIVDTTAPVVTSDPIGACYESIELAEAAALNATKATDNCSDSLIYQVNTIESSCDYLITVTVSDSCGNNSFVIYTTRKNCNSIQVKLFLEGPFDSGIELMGTLLNEYHLLPGQDPINAENNLAQDIGIAAPHGQPYNGAPWNHAGAEGDQYGDDPGDTAYPITVVDWVLLSIRADDSLAIHEVWKCAVLLHDDGEIEIPPSCPCIPNTPGTNYYIVIEHRNHLPVMSPKVESINGNLQFDFTQNQSWIYDPGFLIGNGQKLIEGFYAMFAANGEQVQTRRDINSVDESQWLYDNGTLFQYLNGDHDLNGNVDATDEYVWLLNNSNFTVIPF